MLKCKQRIKLCIITIAIVSFFLMSNNSSASIMVTNGDFENDGGGSGQIHNIHQWSDSNYHGDYDSWMEPGSNTINTTRAGVIGSSATHRPIGWMYQSLGTLDAGATSITYEFDQIAFAAGNSGADFNLRFFFGSDAGGGDGTDIDTLTGLTQLGTTTLFSTLPHPTFNALHHTGSLDVSGYNAGTEIWIDFTANHPAHNKFALIDNVVVSEVKSQSVVPEPATVALLGIGLVGLAGAETRRRRKKKAVDNS